MDVFAQNGQFLRTMMGHSDASYVYSKKDNALIVTSAKTSHITVATRGGEFIEAVDKAGAILTEGGDGSWVHVAVGPSPVRLRFKNLPDPVLTAKQINAARQTVTRYLVQDQPYTLKIQHTLPGAIEWMQKQLASIPAGSRAKAAFDFDTTREHGETYPQIEITYQERETDAEVIQRVQVERERARLADAMSREEFARLRAKFGGDK